MTTETSPWQGDPGTPGPGRAAPGTIIGDRYELRSAIGTGGMGTVWQAVDLVLRRDVAVKEVVLPPNMPPNERTSMYERTLREGRAAAALSHPSVVQVYDVVTDGGRPWIVMELLQARSLSEIIISDGPIAGRAVAKIGIALLGALEVAHSAGVLHRDVKPANVLICGDGRCVLTDFGVARMPSESNLTQPGMVLGSPHFISPERAIGAPFGPPSDLFSLGVTLYTAVEGRPPFDRGDPFETMRAIVEEEALPPVRAGVLAPVLMGLLEKDPARRWTVPTARAALRDLTNSTLAARAAARSAAAAGTVPVQPVVDDSPRGLGGRAMLGAHESVEDRLRHGTGETGTFRAGAHAADPATYQARNPGDSTGSMTPPGGASALPAGAEMPVRAAAAPPRALVPAGASGAGRELAARAGALVNTVRRLPRRTQGLIAGGIAAVLVIVIVAVSLSGGGGKAGGGPVAGPTASAAVTPSFAVKEFSDSRGISLDVPATWTKSTGGSYIDFTDPKDKGRKIRINVESSGKDTATQFLEVAERGLKNPTHCASPYKRVQLIDLTLSGQQGAELEYTCGSGPDERHGVWAAVTSGGHAYHFYLSVEDSAFTESLPIFDEMVRTFKLSTSG